MLLGCSFDGDDGHGYVYDDYDDAILKMCAMRITRLSSSCLPFTVHNT